MESLEFNKYRADILNLFGRYWDLAYQEAKSGVNMADAANQVIVHLEKILRTPVAPASSKDSDFAEIPDTLPDVTGEVIIVPAKIALAIAGTGAISNYSYAENLDTRDLVKEYEEKWSKELIHIASEAGDASGEFQEMRSLLLHLPTGRHYVLDWEKYVSYHYAPPRINKWYDPDENESVSLKRTFIKMSYQLKKEW